jgi:tight adherence protein C
MNSTRVADFKFSDWLPAGVHIDDVIVLLAGLATLVMVLAIWQTFTGDNSFARRLEQISQGKETLRRKALAAPKRRGRPSGVGVMRAAVMRLNLMRSQQADQARAMLVQAGFRTPDAMIRYLFGQITLPFVFGAAALANGYALHIVPVPSEYTLLAAMGAVVAGFYAPRTYLKNIAARRVQRMELALPDGLDLLVICAEAGLSLDTALMRVAKELGGTWPELAEELSITAAELTFLPDRNQAFENLNQRTNMDGVRGVVNTLQQTLKFGTPLARSLRVLAGEFRQQRMTKAEEKAARLPAMLTVPMIIFILPTLFIVMLGPAILGVIDVFSGNEPATASNGSTTTGGVVAAPSTAKKPAGDKTIRVASGGAEEAGDPGEVNVEEVPTAAGAKHRPSDKLTAPRLPKPAVMPTAASVRVVDPMVVDVEARALRTGSNQRLAVVPAGTPDAIADPAAFMRTSIGILPVRTRAYLVPAAPGVNEVRLYDIPQSQTSFVVAARATIEVGPGAKGAILAGGLTREAAALGPEQFAARYRGLSVAIEGQFLRLHSYARGELDAVAADAGRSYAALAVGWTQQPSAESEDGPPSEVLCLMPAEDQLALRRAAALQPGDPILLRGTPQTVGRVADRTAVIVGSCAFAD